MSQTPIEKLVSEMGYQISFYLLIFNSQRDSRRKILCLFFG